MSLDRWKKYMSIYATLRTSSTARSPPMSLNNITVMKIHTPISVVPKSWLDIKWKYLGKTTLTKGLEAECKTIASCQVHRLCRLFATHQTASILIDSLKSITSFGAWGGHSGIDETFGNVWKAYYHHNNISPRTIPPLCLLKASPFRPKPSLISRGLGEGFH